MRAEHVDAFVASAFETLGKIADARPERGSPVLRSGDTLSSRELTALVVLQGDLVGVTFYSMSLATAAKIGGVIRGARAGEVDQFDGSAIGELASMISGAGVALLEEQGCHCTPAEPLIVHGFGEALTGVSPVLLVPLFTEYGDIDVGIALQPAEAISPETQIVAARPVALREAAARSIPSEAPAEELAPSPTAVEEAAAAEVGVVEAVSEEAPEETSQDNLTAEERAQWEVSLRELETEAAGQAPPGQAEEAAEAAPPAAEQEEVEQPTEEEQAA